MMVAECWSSVRKRPPGSATPAVGLASTGGSRVTFAGGMAVTQSAQRSSRNSGAPRSYGTSALRRSVEGRVTFPAGANAGSFDRSIWLRSQPSAPPVDRSAPVQINAQGQGRPYYPYLRRRGRQADRPRLICATAIGMSAAPSALLSRADAGGWRGVGWALSEASRQGRPTRSPGFLDYRCPLPTTCR